MVRKTDGAGAAGARPGQPSSIAELLALHDERFVREAFWVLLGRAADLSGLAYYLGRVREGYSRIVVLDQLAVSAEALEESRHFPGLDKALGTLRASKRLSGWKLAITDIDYGRTPAIRRTRALQNSMGAHRQQLQASIDQLTRKYRVIERMVADLGQIRASTASAAPAGKTEAFNLRVRRPEEVRDDDLPSSARTVINTLRF